MTAEEAPGWQKDRTYVPCPDCKADPIGVVYKGKVVPQSPGSIVHHADCQQMAWLKPTPEQVAEHDRWWAEWRRSQAAAWAKAQTAVIS